MQAGLLARPSFAFTPRLVNLDDLHRESSAAATPSSSSPNDANESSSNRFNMKSIFRMKRSASESGPSTSGPPSSSSSTGQSSGLGLGSTTGAGTGAGPSGIARSNTRIGPIAEVPSPPTLSPITIPARTPNGTGTTLPPSYAASSPTGSAFSPIPSYEIALGQSPTSTNPTSPTVSSLVPLDSGSSFLSYPPPARSAFYSPAIATATLRSAAALGSGSSSFRARAMSQDGSAIDEEDEGESSDDDPLIARPMRPIPQLNLIPLSRRRNTFSVRPSTPPSETAIGTGTAIDDAQLPVELPAPPANALPAYSAHLGRDELRLISSVHLDQTHPAAAFFNHMATTANISSGSQADQERDISTGNKKMRLILTKGAERMNNNGTGPIYIRLPRGGTVSGRIEIGKVDHATRLEVSIIGLVNTSYYVRGQYTLIDTLPLVRRLAVLYPPPEDPANATTDGFTSLSAVQTDQPGASTSATAASTAANAQSTPGSTTASSTPAPAATAHGNGQGSGSARTGTSAPASATVDDANVFSFDNVAGPTVGKEGVPYLRTGQSFDFDLRMPTHHYREANVELPPSCQIFQVGMQAGVEYVLRVKMSRKGWRLNETITIPIIYEPRAYVNPRRLRALTTDDAMNPGWRTIKLHGGEPTTTVTSTEGVEVSLFLPSPPIIFIPHMAEPPPIPFHLHFHSSLTHALGTFSDPTKCDFVVRLMRVATMRIGTEREIRRMEIPTRVEIWQEGGPKIVLGHETRSSSEVTSATAPSAAPAASAPAPTPSATAATPTSPISPTTTRRSSFFRRISFSSDSREPLIRLTSNLQRQPSALPPVVTEEPAATSSTGVTVTAEGATAGTAEGNTAAATDASTPDPDSSAPNEPAANGTTPSAESAAATGIADHPAPAATATATEENGNAHTAGSAFTPLSLSSTDVHLLGQLKIIQTNGGPDLLRKLIQSFMTPEIGITYVIEVGLQPKKGAVKEAFKHVWGGGMVEVVLGSRPLNASRGGADLSRVGT